MREIKFRAWDNVEKRMMNWVDQVHWGNNGIESIAQTTPLQSHKRNVEDVVLMQFTGLKDKNGKEIYEGDVFMDEEDCTYNFVEWNEYYGGWGTNQWYLPKDLIEAASGMEVIGNIYENPELLK